MDEDVVAEGTKRWNEESFFKEGKHQLAMSQFALRTAVGRTLLGAADVSGLDAGDSTP